MSRKLYSYVILLLILLATCHGFIIFDPTKPQQRSTCGTCLTATTRRDWSIGNLASLASILFTSSSKAIAEETVAADAPVDMKLFVDPKGLFSITVPRGFFSIRRTEKGDLPDEKTGKGRRGSSIFTSGDMSKAEIVAIER